MSKIGDMVNVSTNWDNKESMIATLKSEGYIVFSKEQWEDFKNLLNKEQGVSLYQIVFAEEKILEEVK